MVLAHRGNFLEKLKYQQLSEFGRQLAEGEYKHKTNFSLPVKNWESFGFILKISTDTVTRYFWR